MPHLGIDSSAATLLWLAEIACFVLSVFWRPTIGLYLLVPLLPLQTVRYRLHGFVLGDQFIDVLLLGIIIGLKRRGRPIIPKTPLNFLLFGYIAYTYLSMVRGSFYLGVDLPLWFSDPRVSAWKNYVVDLIVMFFVITSAIRTKRQMGFLILAMCVGCLLLAKGFHNNIGGRDFSSFSYDLRDDGPMGFAGVNGLAAFSAQVGIFLLAFYLGTRNILLKMGYLGVLVSCGYCILFALSRGGYGAFLIGILYLGIVRSRILLVVLVIFLLGWQGLVPAAVRDRIFMTTDAEGNVEHSAASRLGLLEEAMQVFQADPVFGTGFNTYSYGSHYEGYGDTHNVYVKVLVETGLVGLLLFLTIFWKLFQIGFRLYRTSPDQFLSTLGLGFSGLMVAVFIANVFGDRWMYFQITGYTYACAAMAVRGQEMVAEMQDEAEEAESFVPELADAPL